MSKTMCAVLLMGHGGYEQLAWREDWPIPEPGPGEVLIRVAAAGINNTDINTRTAWYARAVNDDSGWTGEPLRFPRIQGADACGRIVAVGGGVAASRLGERVLVEPVFRGNGAEGGHPAIYFGSECDGAFAEYVCVPAAHAHCIVSALSDVELASFPCAYSAAENMLSRLALARGETVLITGASGGVGSAAIQLARRRGAEVIAVAGAGKSDALRALGAARVLERTADIRQTLGAESVDAVVDVVGGAGFPALLQILRRGGRYAVAGAIAGAEVSLDLRTLYLKDLSLFGCTVFEPRVFANLVRYIESGEIRPMVAAVHPLRDIVAAQIEFLEKRHIGKIVLSLAT